MASLHCIYGTTGGNTELVVDQVVEVLKEKGIRATAARAEQSCPEDFSKADVLLLASSTYGHGCLQDFMEVFLEQVRKAGLPLQGKSYAVIGLGDPKYDPEHHIEAAPILEKFLNDQGGKKLIPSLKISRSPVPHLDLRIKAWAGSLAELLNVPKSR